MPDSTPQQGPRSLTRLSPWWFPGGGTSYQTLICRSLSVFKKRLKTQLFTEHLCIWQTKLLTFLMHPCHSTDCLSHCLKALTSSQTLLHGNYSCCSLLTRSFLYCFSSQMYVDLDKSIKRQMNFRIVGVAFSFPSPLVCQGCADNSTTAEKLPFSQLLWSIFYLGT